MKKICGFILKIFGWKVVGKTDYPDKCVVCVAPHTSNWDLIIGLLVYGSLGKQPNFLMKKEWFFFPFGPIFRALGGIPVDRSTSSSLTETMANLYKTRDKFQLGITPEATRKPNPNWKFGFYHIANLAHVPIVIVAMDYKKKEVDFKKIMIPSGNFEADVAEIKDCYKGVTGRHPENFILN